MSVKQKAATRARASARVTVPTIRPFDMYGFTRIDEWRTSREAFAAALDKRQWGVYVALYGERMHAVRGELKISRAKGRSIDNARMHELILLVDSMAQEINALCLESQRAGGRERGAIGENQKILRALLTENPDADTHSALLRLNEARPGHRLGRRSIAVELTRAREALGIKRS